MSNVLDRLGDLQKALTAGNYDAKPSALVQGAALQIEDISSEMNITTYEQKHIKLQSMLESVDCKSTLAQFDRQLSYGIFGGSAQSEGDVGQEETSDYVRIAMPMNYYSSTRRVTIASTKVATVDGKKSDERAASDAAIKLSGDIEFDMFRGMDDFSNAGSFDGNPLVIPQLPAIHGVGLQIRQSDTQVNARDAMFAEFGSDDSVVLSSGGVLVQERVEDLALRSALNFGDADKLVVDPVVLSGYNKITFGKERIILAGSAQDVTGGDLKRQFVSGGTVNIEASQFLRGKSKPQRNRATNGNAPSAPSATYAVAAAGAAIPAAVYVYYVTAGNAIGESLPSATSANQTVTTGDKVTVTITPSGTGTSSYFNVYRSAAGGSAATAKYIGRVFNTGATTTDFVDLGNKLPGFVTGYLLAKNTMEIRQLMPYSRLKLAQTDLSIPEAYFRFLCLVVKKPRQMALLDNIKGTP